MKKIAFYMLLVVVALASCNQKQQATEEVKTEETPAAESPTVQVKLADLATNKDLYCGMELEEGYITDTASYEGKLYGFCATECKAEFLKAPQQYLSTK